MLVEGVSLESLSMEAVSARAGVGKATLYRRWPNKESLVVDALASLSEPPATVSGRSTRRDLIQAIDDLHRWASDSRSARLLPHLLSGIRNSDSLRAAYLRLIIEPRKAVIRDILDRGIRAHELAPEFDVEMTVTILFGGVLSRFMLVGEQLAADMASDAELPERTVDLILSGATAD